MSIYTISLGQNFSLIQHATIIKKGVHDRMTEFAIESPVLPDDLSMILLPDAYDGWALVKAVAERIIKAEARLNIKSNQEVKA